MPEIDWDRCFEDLEEQFPQIRGDLRRRINALLPLTISYGVYLDNHPPNISIDFAFHRAADDELREVLPDIAKVIGDVAEEYDLKAYRGGYNLLEKCKKKKWIKSEFRYTLKPHFKKYEGIEEPK